MARGRLAVDTDLWLPLNEPTALTTATMHTMATKNSLWTRIHRDHRDIVAIVLVPSARFPVG